MNFSKKISESQLKELRYSVRMEKNSTVLKRIQAIIMLEDKASASLIKMATGYEREVAVKLRREFIEYGSEALEPKRKEKEPKLLLTKNQKNEIVNVLNTQKPNNYGINCELWTTKILGYLIKEQYGVEYKSKTSFYLIFKQAKFTFRKPEKQSEKYDEKRIKEWKEKYKSIIQEECARHDTVVLAGDEAALSSETRLQRVWLPTQKPAFIQDTSNRKMLHLYGFLDVQSGVAIAYQTDRQCGETTVSVLKKLIQEYPNKRIVIFWDNASWHKSKEVRDYLATTKQFKLYNFPTYAPELNPQEHVWKEMREKVLNNVLIKDIKKAAKSAVEFINNSLFKYKFYGVHGTFNV